METKDKDGRTTLHNACQRGASVEEVKVLIAQGADVNARDDNLMTPLFLAGSIEVIDVLLANGADINAIRSSDDTPLTAAIQYWKSYDRAEALISRGANVNAPGFGGLTALHHAAQTHRNYSINNPAYLMEESQLEPLAKLLIKNGANVDALIPDDGSRYAGATPLHLAADGQNLPVIKELIANGANVNARKRDGLTPLGVAILAHHMKAAAVLVAAGVRLEQRDVQRKFESRRSVEGEMTLLCHILLANPSATSVHLTELFISAGADVNAASELMGRTPLMYAIMGTFANHEEKTARLQMVALLIRNGADPNREGNNRNSALDIARSQAKWAVAALRGEKQAETTTPHEPSQPVADMHGEKQAKTTTPHEPSRPVADLQGEKHAGTTTAHELPTGRQWWEFWK